VKARTLIQPQTVLFILQADCPSAQERIDSITSLVYQLPPVHATALAFLINHLRRVADNHDKNMV
jgi:hypothetical protein